MARLALQDMLRNICPKSSRIYQTFLKYSPSGEGMTSIHFITQGCALNTSDTEYMQGLLSQAQFTISPALEDADVVVLNLWNGKAPQEDELFSQLAGIQKEYPYKIIIVAGCSAQTDKDRLKGYALLGARQIHRIVEVVEEALNDNMVKALGLEEMPPLNLPKIRKNPIVEIIPIGRSSAASGTAAPGQLQSYPLADIVQLATKAVQEGVKEIRLTSPDTMCYGFDGGSNLALLLEELIKIPGDFKIHVGRGNPVHLQQMKEKLFPLFQNEKVFKFLHLPAYSGSSRVLKALRRGHTKEEFLALIEAVKVVVPEITIATDIMVGYPTETEDDHWQTLQLLRDVSPDIVNVSSFWARPGTPAAKLPSLPSEVIGHRLKVVTDISTNISKLQNERWKGWEGNIIIGEQSKEAGPWIGRNYCYKPVIVEGNFKLGDIVQVKIEKTGVSDLKGKIIS